MDVCRLGVIIPAYNAESTIREIIRELVRFGIKPSNIVVVDDGSIDATGEISAQCGVQAIKHQRNRGKGAALKTGIQILRLKNVPGVFIIDADGQHHIPEIGRFLPRINRYDLVIGWRHQQVAMPWLRRIVNRVTSLVISLFVNMHIPDVQCGFRFISLRIFDTVTLTTNHYQTESEMVVKAVRGGYRLTFVPITAIYSDQKSYIHPITDTLRFIRMATGLLWA